MVLRVALGAALALGCLAAGCGDDVGPVTDAGTDAADTGPLVSAPAAPVLTPCATDWVETMADDGFVQCEPWATAPPEACAEDEGIFPGEEGCVRVGTACPTGEYAEDLPGDVRIYYVNASVVPGGDGSIGAPFARVGDALARAFAGSIVAIGKGTYDGVLRPRAGVTLWGACTAETVLTNTDAPDERGGVIEPQGADTVIRNLRITPVDQGGITCLRECSLHVEDVVVAGGASAGIGVGFGGTLTARSLVVRDTDANSGGVFGRGVTIDSESTAEIRRAFFDGNTDVGVACFRASLVLEDAYVRNTRFQPFDRDFGRGIAVEEGGSAELRRVVVERNVDIGIFVNEDASLLAEDIVVRDTQPQEAFRISGRAVAVQLRSSIELRRALLERNAEVTLYCGGEGAVLDAEDVVIRDTQQRLSDERGGRAAGFEEGCDARVSRLVAERNGGAAITASYGSSVELTDLTVRDVDAETCPPEICGSSGFGVGVGAYQASVRVERFVIEDSTLCGVQIALDGQLDLMTGIIQRAQIGACVQVGGYGLERLQNEVIYIDNDVNLETTELPVPDPLGGA